MMNILSYKVSTKRGQGHGEAGWAVEGADSGDVSGAAGTDGKGVTDEDSVAGPAGSIWELFVMTDATAGAPKARVAAPAVATAPTPADHTMRPRRALPIRFAASSGAWSE
jgi:hypothetical protein